MGVLASQETDSLARQKGFKNGFVGLIQPYGERITGKVVVRDSVGVSRSWEDFGLRFLDLQDAIQEQPPKGPQILENLEDLVEHYLEQHTGEHISHGFQEISPYYRLLLGRLCSSQPLSTHETFSHPVAAIIAISSSTPAPIETLRNLYAQTAQGGLASPAYMNPEYLRYYLLVHDDDKDDFTKSSALFDQMKRHFGLHCHMLRLRSLPCDTNNDEDAEEVPQQEWISASSDLSKLQETTQLIDLDESLSQQIFSTDAAALRVFARELASQSIVPYMEQRISFWNEQIASRRRGISGRFMSLSKRWGGIGGLGTSRNSSATNLSTTSSSSGNYDTVLGYYRWETPEALLRKMGDFAIMLRDYKLAASTYDLLRSDYNNDKAWRYLAGVNEMCSITNLLNPLLSSSTSSSSGSKSLPKLETFDSMLEAASYSYLTRCNEPALALRSILLTIELLKVRGRLASELASKWTIRALDLNLAIQGTNTHVLISERVASCFAGNRPLSSANSSGPQSTNGTNLLSHRTRHAALWSLTSAEEWMKLGRPAFAAARIDDAQELYAELPNHETSIAGFKEMNQFMNGLSLAVRMKLGQSRHRGASGTSATGRLVEPGTGGDPLGVGMGDREDDIEEQMEKIDVRPKRAAGGGHQRNLTLNSAIETPAGLGGPLSPVRSRGDPLMAEGVVDDGFE